MSNFNTPINAGGLLDTLQDSKQTREDQYICDRESYMKGRAGVNVESFYNQREQDMYDMGRSAYEHFEA
jgi:hypothetical protein